MNVELFREASCLTTGPRNEILVNGTLETAKKNNIPYTLYDRKSFLDKYPQIHLDQDEAAIIDHSAGIVFPETNVRTFLEHAEKHGAKILENSRVMYWTEEENGVKIFL